MGFRHGHILSLLSSAKQRDDVEIVAACEEHEETRRKLTADGKVTFTHALYDELLDAADCDVVAIGDYYGRRGELAIKALQRGKHVIADKPLCTRLAELDAIESISRQKNLKVGLMLDMRDASLMPTMKQAIANGDIGDVHAIGFGGQHPLMYGTRPGWYFEPGKHGGTLTDIAIHAVNFIPWMTGLKLKTVNSARNWNARLKDVPHFKDAGQVMLTLDNGCGVLGDVSYFLPDSFGYTHPLYWRVTVWGSKGVMEGSVSTPVTLYKDGEKTPRTLSSLSGRSGGYLADFIADIRGAVQTGQLDTAEVIRSSRHVLQIQAAADEQKTNVALA